MSVKNNKREQAKNTIAKVPAPSKATSEPIDFTLVHSTVLNKELTLNSRSFTRYSLDDNGGGYLGL